MGRLDKHRKKKLTKVQLAQIYTAGMVAAVSFGEHIMNHI